MREWQEFMHTGTEILKHRAKIDLVCITGYYEAQTPALDFPESLDDALEVIDDIEGFCRKTYSGLEINRIESPKFVFPKMQPFHYSSFIYANIPEGNILSARFNVYHPTIGDLKRQGYGEVEDISDCSDDSVLPAILRGEFVFPLGEYAEHSRAALKKVYDDLDCIAMMKTPAGYQPAPEIALVQDGKIACIGFAVLRQMGILSAMKEMSFEHGYMRVHPPLQN